MSGFEPATIDLAPPTAREPVRRARLGGWGFLIENSMPENVIEIPPATGPIRGQMTPPGSKSLTNRALVCAALAHGQSTLTGVLDSEDTQIMGAAWRALGVEINESENRTRCVVRLWRPTTG
jgi:hypothetical protein